MAMVAVYVRLHEMDESSLTILVYDSVAPVLVKSLRLSRD